MDPTIEIQKEKYLEVGFEVSKRLAQAGYNPEKPAYSITWGQIAEELGYALVDLGIEPSQVPDGTLSSLVDEVRDALVNQDILHWREVIQFRITALEDLIPENREPDQEPDEGALVEEYENATRLGDEEGYWVDGGVSADLFDDF